MDRRLIGLKLVLDALGVDSDIGSVGDRKRIQKAVYLAQEAGVGLGHHFGWYLMGPYSPSLARDYYDMALALDCEALPMQDERLRRDVADILRTLSTGIRVPDECGNMPDEDWLELLASYHYLRSRAGLDPNAAEKALRKEKPHVAEHVKAASKTLKAAGLLN